jgi:hypothetical protein
VSRSPKRSIACDSKRALADRVSLGFDVGAPIRPEKHARINLEGTRELFGPLGPERRSSAFALPSACAYQISAQNVRSSPPPPPDCARVNTTWRN